MTARPLSALQLKQLSADLNPARIAQRAQGRGGGPKLSYLEAWDVRTALIRIFGYGGFSYKTNTEVLQVEPAVPKANGQGTQFRFTVMATVKLYIYQLECFFQESAVSSQSQPDPGECADFAVKTAESDALKRCAVNLGTQFGLSLYNKGSATDVVKVVRAPGQAAILARLAAGETAAAIDADTAKSLKDAVDVAEPADKDRTYGYDPDHGDTGLSGGGVAEPPAPGEDPAEDQLPEPSPERASAARADVRGGFKRTQP